MKNASKRDKRCEWQNPASQEIFERTLRFRVSPEKAFVSER